MGDNGEKKRKMRKDKRKEIEKAEKMKQWKGEKSLENKSKGKVSKKRWAEIENSG